MNDGSALHTQQSTRALAPGWYLLENDPSREQFWNGMMWTDLIRHAPVLSEFLGPIEPLILAVLDHHDRRAMERQALQAQAAVGPAARRSFFEPAA